MRTLPGLTRIGWRPTNLLSSEDIRNRTIDFRDPRTHDLETCDGAHVNSIAMRSDCEVFVSLGIIWTGKFRLLFRVKRLLKGVHLWQSIVVLNRAVRYLLKLRAPMHSELAFQPAMSKSVVIRTNLDGNWEPCFEVRNATTPSHSLLLMEDGKLIYLDTSAGKIVQIDSRTGRLIASTKVTDGFLRGSERLSERTIVVGSRGELITFDLNQCRVTNRLRLSDDPSESVFAIRVLPNHFAALPQTLEEPEKLTPVEGLLAAS